MTGSLILKVPRPPGIGPPDPDLFQGLGLMESLAIIFTLLFLLFLEKYVRLRSNNYLYFANVFFF